ncbi:MAG: hypothetical protein D6797_01540 [Bdellovibrio sp.]|nr:MAG: hypothetical protein D6797_01540 [Bdellovibrio sp.]
MKRQVLIFQKKKPKIKKKVMGGKLKKIVLVLLFLAVSPVMASTDTSFSGYEQIIQDLSRSTKKLPRSSHSNINDPFDQVEIHTGLAFTSSYTSLKEKDFQSALMSGIQLSLGIDLFSPFWVAEGTMRSVNGKDAQKNIETSLKTFDLRFLYHNQLSSKVHYKVGAGIGAQYLKVQSLSLHQNLEINDSTPSVLFVTQLSIPFSSAVSLGSEIIYQKALIEETINSNSLDASIRLDFHF